MTTRERERWLRRAAQAWLILMLVGVAALIVAYNGWAGVEGIGVALACLISFVALAYLLDF